MDNFFKALGTKSMRKKVRKMAQDRVAYSHLEQFVKALDHDNRVVRWWAVEGLGNTGGSHPLPALIKAAADPDVEVARKAVDAVRDRRWNSDDVPVLKAALLSSVPRLKEAAADKLLELDWQPNENQVRLLGAEFWVNRWRWEQCRVIGAPAMQGLLRLLDWRPSPSCVETLAVVGGEETAAPLIDFLVDRLNGVDHPHLRDDFECRRSGSLPQSPGRLRCPCAEGGSGGHTQG